MITWTKPLPPMPPPYPGRMKEIMADVQPESFAMRLWGVLSTTGPLPYGVKMRDALPNPMPSSVWHEHMRYHHEKYRRQGNSIQHDMAYEEHIQRGLDHGVRRGWLTVDSDGVYSAAGDDPRKRIYKRETILNHKDEIRALRLAGWSQKDIANELGLNVKLLDELTRDWPWREAGAS